MCMRCELGALHNITVFFFTRAAFFSFSFSIIISKTGFFSVDCSSFCFYHPEKMVFFLPYSFLVRVNTSQVASSSYLMFFFSRILFVVTSSTNVWTLPASRTSRGLKKTKRMNLKWVSFHLLLLLFLAWCIQFFSSLFARLKQLADWHVPEISSFLYDSRGEQWTVNGENCMLIQYLHSIDTTRLKKCRFNFFVLCLGAIKQRDK